MSELERRLLGLVSLNDPSRGGPYGGTAAAACMEAMKEAAAEIARLRAENERLRWALSAVVPPNIVDAIAAGKDAPARIVMADPPPA